MRTCRLPGAKMNSSLAILKLKLVFNNFLPAKNVCPYFSISLLQQRSCEIWQMVKKKKIEVSCKKPFHLNSGPCKDDDEKTIGNNFLYK
jgi:hypothetical protein